MAPPIGSSTASTTTVPSKVVEAWARLCSAGGIGSRRRRCGGASSRSPEPPAGTATQCIVRRASARRRRRRRGRPGRRRRTGRRDRATGPRPPLPRRWPAGPRCAWRGGARGGRCRSTCCTPERAGPRSCVTGRWPTAPGCPTVAAQRAEATASRWRARSRPIVRSCSSASVNASSSSAVRRSITSCSCSTITPVMYITLSNIRTIINHQSQRVLCKMIFVVYDGGVPVQSTRVENLAMLRAFLHPLRIELLAALRVDGPATASELARRLGESSGATSYHLRQLARYGYVVDDDEQPSGRERRWRRRAAADLVPGRRLHRRSRRPVDAEAARAGAGTAADRQPRAVVRGADHVAPAVGRRRGGVGRPSAPASGRPHPDDGRDLGRDHPRTSTTRHRPAMPRRRRW